MAYQQKTMFILCIIIIVLNLLIYINSEYIFNMLLYNFSYFCYIIARVSVRIIVGKEKRNAILGVYHSTKEVYTEKEIIALAAKAGVNQNT